MHTQIDRVTVRNRTMIVPEVDRGIFVCHDSYIPQSGCIAGIMKEIIGKCVPDAKVVEICEFGDQRILEETSKVYKKEKEMKKGKTMRLGNSIARAYTME